MLRIQDLVEFSQQPRQVAPMIPIWQMRKRRVTESKVPQCVAEAGFTPCLIPTPLSLQSRWITSRMGPRPHVMWRASHLGTSRPTHIYSILCFVLLDTLARACQMRVLIWVLAIRSPKLYVFQSCLTKSLPHHAFKNKSLASYPKPEVRAPEEKLGCLYF